MSPGLGSGLRFAWLRAAALTRVSSGKRRGEARAAGKGGGAAEELAPAQALLGVLGVESLRGLLVGKLAAAPEVGVVRGRV